MPATYSGDPTTSTKDAVRLLMGDTDVSFPLMQDSEILYVIGVATPIYNDDFMTASICCDIVANGLAREINISADGVSASADTLMRKLQDTAVNLRAMYSRIVGAGGAPYAGGIDRFEPPDFSVKRLNFGLGFMDNARAGQQNFGEYGEYLGSDWAEPESGYWTGG